MATLSIDGLVYLSDQLDRRQLIRLAPALSVDRVLTRTRTTIDNAEEHAIDEISDLDGSVAKMLLFSVLAGSATLALTRAGSTLTLDNVGTIIIMDASDIEAVTVTGSSDGTVYDLILGSYA